MYLTDKDSALFSEKGEKPPEKDDHVVVVACALVNGYSDKSVESIQVHYITTKYYYEGIGYASKLISDMLINTQNKGKYCCIMLLM